MHNTLILEAEEGSQLIKSRRDYSSREVFYYISDVPVKVFPLTLLYVGYVGTDPSSALVSQTNPYTIGPFGISPRSVNQSLT